MQSNTILRILNPIQGLLILSQVTTGLFHETMTHEVFEWVHMNAGKALLLCVIAHVSLNWGWVKTTYFKRKTAG